MNELSYRLKWSEDLYWAYRRFKWDRMMRSAPLYRYDFWRRVGLFVSGLALCLLAVAVVQGDSRELASMMLGFGLGYWIYYSYLVYRNRRGAAEECDHTISMPEVRVAIDPSGVRIVGPHCECRTSWQEYTSIEVFDSGLILWDEQCDCGIPVPDDALLSGTNRETVRQQFDAWRRAAQ